MAKEAKTINNAETAHQGDDETVVAEQVLIVTAPGGPRRRAGFSFGPEPVELTQDQLGNSADEIKDTLDVLRADPLLKIDGRFRERPANED